MNKLFMLIALTGFVSCSIVIKAQTFWTGPTKTFVKTDSADWTMEANQDRITDSVWLARAHKQSLFNIKTETKYTTFSSPADTEWAFGTTADIGTLTFQNLQAANGSNPSSMINKDMVLHLISEDIYLDIEFLTFSGGGSGGGFSYARSTNQNLDVVVFELNTVLAIYPNPSSAFIEIFGLSQTEEIKIYNAFGQIVYGGSISKDERVDTQALTKGMYILKFQNGRSVKFIKD